MHSMRLLLLVAAMMRFLNRAAMALDASCNCTVDNCLIPSMPPPFSTVCWANGTLDQEVSVDQGPTGFQACQNATYADMFGAVDLASVANTTNCQLLMTTFLDPTFETNYLMASQIYNSTMLSLAAWGDCFLFMGGGAGATPDAIDVDDTFWVGNMDLAYAVSNSIISYAYDGNSSHMAACGTLPLCGFYNPITGQAPGSTPDIAWCVGGYNLGQSWIEKNGSYGWPTQDQETLIIPVVAHIPVLEPDNDAVALPSPPSDVAVHNFSATSKPPPPQPKARVTYTLQCGSKNEQVYTLPQCVIYFDTSCDENGNVRSSSYECYMKCSCTKQIIGGQAPGGVCYVGGSASQKCVREVDSAETLLIDADTNTDANNIEAA